MVNYSCIFAVDFLGGFLFGLTGSSTIDLITNIKALPNVAIIPPWKNDIRSPIVPSSFVSNHIIVNTKSAPLRNIATISNIASPSFIVYLNAIIATVTNVANIITMPKPTRIKTALLQLSLGSFSGFGSFVFFTFSS